MKRIKKYIDKKPDLNLKKKLEDYSTLSKGFNKSYEELEKSKGGHHNKALVSILALAAASVSPLTADAQCIVSYSGVDLDGDMQADVFFSYFFWTDGGGGGSCWSSEQIYQIRVLGAPGADVRFYGSGAGIPRACYVNACLFPYANGATTAADYGSVGVLFSSVNSCSFCVVSTQNCFTSCSTYTTTNGNMTTNCWTTCTTSFFTSTNCDPTINNGNFPPNTPGTIAIKLNGTFYFMELELYGDPLVKSINGVTPQNCDPDGCLDTVSILGNKPIPGLIYRAEKLIETDGIVQSGDSVILKSGEEIDLKENFTVDTNAVLVTEIEPCPPALSSIPADKIAQPVLQLHRDCTKVAWEVPDAYGIFGFEIQRGTNPHNFRKIGWTEIRQGHKQYVFADKSARPDMPYFYRLKQIHTDGNILFSEDIRSQPVKRKTQKLASVRIMANDLHVQVLVSGPGVVDLDLMDSFGHRLLTTQKEVHRGNNHIIMPLSQKLSGRHYLKLTLGSESMYELIDEQD